MPQTPAFYFDILENLAQGRCPACELVRRKPMHYIDHALYGLVTDPQAQNLFAETGGYCRRHAGMLLQIPWGSALGVAILYNRLIEDAAEALSAERGQAAGPEAFPDLKYALEISALCNRAELKAEGGRYSVLGNPTEGALVVAAAKAGITKEGLLGEGARGRHGIDEARPLIHPERRNPSDLCPRPHRQPTQSAHRS